VRDKPGVADESKKVVDNRREQRLAGQKLARQAMHAKRLLGHVALRIEVYVKGLSRRDCIVNLDTTDFDDSIALQRIEPGRFRIEYNFTHQAGFRLGREAAARPRRIAAT